MLRWRIEEVELGGSFLLKGNLGISVRQKYNRGAGISMLGLRGDKISTADLGINQGWDPEKYHGLECSIISIDSNITDNIIRKFINV